MSHNLLSQIEAGCNGRMKLENGKIVFELIPTSSIHHVSVPAPSAPPLIEDNHIIDELRDELREMKERLELISERYDKLEKLLYQFQESVCIPKFINSNQACQLYNFNTKILRFIDAGWSNQPSRNYLVYVGNTNLPFGDQTPLPTLLDAIDSHLRPDINHFIIQPRQTITPDCGVVIKFIIDWVKTSPNNIEITIMNIGVTLSMGFVVSLCEQLNHDKLSKLKITQAKISEQTELRNKVAKALFKKIEIENLVPSV
jgi:hypothetical protein